MAGCHTGLNGRQTLRRGALVVALVTGTAGAGLLAAELQDETVAAWELYIAATEQRIAAEFDDGERFLVLDLHEEAAKLRRAVLAGRVVIERLETLERAGRVDQGAGGRNQPLAGRHSGTERDTERRARRPAVRHSAARAAGGRPGIARPRARRRHIRALYEGEGGSSAGIGAVQHRTHGGIRASGGRSGLEPDRGDADR